MTKITSEQPVEYKPYLKPWYQISYGSDSIIIKYAQHTIEFHGRAIHRFIPLLLPALDGTRTISEISISIGEGTLSAVNNVLQKLASHGLLLDGLPVSSDVAPSIAEAALFHFANSGHIAGSRPTPEEIVSRLSQEKVGFIGHSGTVDIIARLLLSSGVGFTNQIAWDDASSISDYTVIVVAPLSEEVLKINAWNQLSMNFSTPWLAVTPFDGRYACVGPLVCPGETACWYCFQRRRQANADNPQVTQAIDATIAYWPCNAALNVTQAGIAATLLLRWLIHKDQYIPASLTSIEYDIQLRANVSYVHRLPRCPVCSILSTRPAPYPWLPEV